MKAFGVPNLLLPCLLACLLTHSTCFILFSLLLCFDFPFLVPRIYKSKPNSNSKMVMVMVLVKCKSIGTIVGRIFIG
jgi:hypothetical protein